MKIYSKAFLFPAKKPYKNYILTVEAYPPARIRVDSVENDFSKVYASNVTTQNGYLQFYVDMALYKLICVSERIREVTEQSTYWRVAINPTMGGMEIGNTYEIPCQIAERNSNKVVQEFVIYYTRKL